MKLFRYLRKLRANVRERFLIFALGWVNHIALVGLFGIGIVGLLFFPYSDVNAVAFAISVVGGILVMHVVTTIIRRSREKDQHA